MKLPQDIGIKLFSNSYELLYSLRQRHTPSIVVDTSVIVAASFKTSKDIHRILSFRSLFDLITDLNIELLIPSAVLYDLWAALARSNVKREDIPRVIRNYIDRFTEIPTIITQYTRRTMPLIVRKLRIRFVADEPQDLELYPDIGLYDSVILNIARRTNSFLITTEKSLCFLKHAKEVKIVNSCSWAIAQYYADEIFPRYMKTLNPQPRKAIDWILAKEHRIRKLLQRMNLCIEHI